MSYTKPTLNGCLEWTRCFNSDGYPRAVFEHSNGKVHREVFELVNGYYPLVVRHTCDNVRCLNPEHLEGGTAVDNENDRYSRGRVPNQWTSEQKQEVLRLREQGHSYKTIADAVNKTLKGIDGFLYLHRRGKVKG